MLYEFFFSLSDDRNNHPAGRAGMLFVSARHLLSGRLLVPSLHVQGH